MPVTFAPVDELATADQNMEVDGLDDEGGGGGDPSYARSRKPPGSLSLDARKMHKVRGVNRVHSTNRRL
jgi:hypothetical protein